MTKKLRRFSFVAAIAVHSQAVSASSQWHPTEETFLSAPQAESARSNLKFITSIPHVAGTTGDYIMAHYVEQQFQLAGLPNVSIFELNVSLNYPQGPPQVALISKSNHTVIYKARLEEKVLPFDDTSNTTWRTMLFHGYSPSGNVTAPLVYANYGRPQDFEDLAKHNISVKDRIVLVRYGECFRGLKVMNAQDRGAVGVIIYSDPAEDGTSQGPVYPQGPWKPSFGVQRGSVQFNSKCGGDPARADQRYQESNETVSTICGYSANELTPTIPSIPMSYGDAQQFLSRLGGTQAIDVATDFVGGLNLTYHVGPSQDWTVRMVVSNKDTITSIPNVIGYIPGHDEEMPVLLGNHRDAWVYGAADPNSGTASLIEVARGLGKLLKTGWKPRRSIYLLSWSGEEYGLLGSTGWAELNAPSLKNAVAYLNADTAVSGDLLSVAITPSLSKLWEGVLRDLQYFSKFANGPVGEMVDANTNRRLDHPEHQMLGSGSDYTVFLDHLGIASLDFSFGKHAHYGQYHSIYDSFSWMDSFGGRSNETGSAFELMAFAAKIWGLLCLRLADCQLLPFDHVEQAKSLQHYVEDIRSQKAARNLNLHPLDVAVKHYQDAALILQMVCASGSVSKDVCNKKLALAERKFLSMEGLPKRPWFKHVLQAPGLYLGYAAQAFPGIQDAIDQRNGRLARRQVDIVAERIEAAANYLKVSTR